MASTDAEQIAENPQFVRPQFVLFGSSIVQYSFYRGWGANLAHVYARKADIVLRGYAGWNSRRAVKVLDEVFPKNAPKQPELVIVYFGGNDSTPPHISGNGPHVPLDEYKDNMKQIALHLKSLSENTRIIFLGVPPINEDIIKDRKNEDCEKYSKACFEMCVQDDIKENIKFIDVWNLIQKIDNWKKVCTFKDGVHLTAAGNKVVSDAIVKVLQEEADWNLKLEKMSAHFGEDSQYDPLSHEGKPTNISHAPFPYTIPSSL